MQNSKIQASTEVQQNTKDGALHVTQVTSAWINNVKPKRELNSST